MLRCTHVHGRGGIRLHALEETEATLVAKAPPTEGQRPGTRSPTSGRYEGPGQDSPSTVLSLSPSICWMGMAVVTRGLEHLICLAQSSQEGSWERRKRP